MTSPGGRLAERPVGAHMPLAIGMLRAADRAAEIGANAIQVFADNPVAWKRRDEAAGDLPEFRERLRTHGIQHISIHAAYLINLAGPDPDFFEKSVATLAAELAAGSGYGARIVNVHTGSHRGSGLRDGIARLAEGVARAFEGAAEAIAVEGGQLADLPILALENAAGGGWTIGSTVEELADAAEAIAQRGLSPGSVGFCLDTAHLWAAGYPIDRPDEFDRVVDMFERELGLDRLVMVHLNDSKSERGARVDRHQHVGAGMIGEAGLGHVIRHPKLDGAMFICETPGMDRGYDAVNVARMRALLAGEQLEALSEEALTMSRKPGSPPVPVA
jgi:deoxyribonuclease-4